MNSAALAVIVAPAPRQFRTVKGALLWYRNERNRRMGMGQDPGRVNAIGPRDEIVKRDLTFGLVAACLKPETGKAAVLTAPMLQRLIGWFCTDRSKSMIADEMGLSEHVMSRLMGRLEWALAQRMRARKLLEERSKDETW